MNLGGSLSEVPANLSGAPLLLVLGGMGLVVGIATGLFGVGGGFMITPLLNAILGIPYSLVVGSSLSFTLGTSSGAWARHLRLGNVEVKTMFILGGAAVCGTVLGADLHEYLRDICGKENFTLVMHGMFIVLLLLVAGLVWFGTQHERTDGKNLLQRCPLGPRISLPGAGLEGVSMTGLCLLGVVMGLGKGMLGIGGGVLFMPALLLVVGLDMHKAIGTSLDVVLFSSLAGVILYGSKGQASLWIVFPLLITSSIGAQIGVSLSQKLHAEKIRRYFAIMVMAVCVYIAMDFVFKLLKAN